MSIHSSDTVSNAQSEQNTSTANQSQLGQQTVYCNQYDPSLLFGIPRQEKRDELGFDLQTLPFSGVDVWSAFEISWLNLKGKPIVAWAEFHFPASSPNLVESKSFKLYLNSFNGSRFANQQAVVDCWIKDLSAVCGGEVSVKCHKVTESVSLKGTLPGVCLDELDIEVNDYQVAPKWLTVLGEEEVNETVNSHLLKSNCLVTGQPDWGSVVIEYQGKPICQEGLLKYLISFREHNEFHEQCVERIFTDIMKYCEPKNLTVYARYVRRGGLDINPYRTNLHSSQFAFSRTVRQ